MMREKVKGDAEKKKNIQPLIKPVQPAAVHGAESASSAGVGTEPVKALI